MRFGAAVLALWLLTGCGGGGGGGGGAPDGAGDVQQTTIERGVPMDLPVSGEAINLSYPAGDDYLLILTSQAAPSGLAEVAVNGGTTALPPLGRSRARVGLRRDPALPAVPQPAGPPSRQSEHRSFQLGGIGFATTVAADLRYQGERCLFYVDTETPPADLTNSQLAELGGLFDQAIYAPEVALFGEPSDIDGNQRVVVLFTPWVNRRGFGVFSPADLAPSGGNQADMVYALVPQPSQGLDYANLREGLLATLAHELQHLINYNQKHLLAGLSGEESWLNEGLSFNAEQAGGWLDSPGGSPENVAAYFASPERYPLIELSGSYQDGHVGASYLFVRYLADRFGEQIYRRLTTSGSTGRANVAAATGTDFGTLLKDWAAAVYLTGTGLTQEARYLIRGFDTHGSYTNGGTLSGPAVTTVDASSGQPAFSAGFARAGLRYIRLAGPPAGGLTLRLAAPPADQVQALVVRVPR